MNNLTVRATGDNGLSFELLIDGQPIGLVLGDGNEGIPYWLAQQGLPTYPPSDYQADSLVRIVSVCGCGEYGCGHSRCTISPNEKTVEFSGFAGDVGVKGAKLRFVFPLEQYETVCDQMARLANERLSTEG